MAIDGPGGQSGSDSEPGLLVVEDDHAHCYALQRAFERRGYEVKSANSVPQALAVLGDWSADYAVIDLRLPGPSGLTMISRLKGINPHVRIVVMTGYASIATAVEAIKLGAVHYLTKPVDADMIERSFQRVQGDQSIVPLPQRLSVTRLAWEHIQGTLADHGGNISAAARALGMHRRTLQRKLGKHPTRL
jgi:two-component system response regulator RegA